MSELAAGIELKPNLLAGFDFAAKLILALALVSLPLLGPAIASGEFLEWIIGILAADLFFGFLAIGGAIMPVIMLAVTTYSLDDDGVSVRSSLVARQQQRVPWEKVTALRQRRTTVDLLFGLHRIDVIAYGEKGAVMHLVGLRDPTPLRDLIARKMRDSATPDSWLQSD